jgi:hypothetical protein
MKKCPYCAEEIQDEAIKCKFCGEFLDKKKSSVLDITKGFLNQTGVFLKDLKQKHEENKYKHLWYPSDIRPFELNGAIFYSDHFEYRQIKYLYKDIKEITIHSKETIVNVSVQGDFTTTFYIHMPNNRINLSRSRVLLIGFSQKTYEKMIFIASYLRKNFVPNLFDQFGF